VEDKRDSQTWQELLQQLIENPKEKERIASLADIQPITLMRWIKGISTPRLENMRALLKAIPSSSVDTFMQLASADFPTLLSEHTESQDVSPEPLLDFYVRVLEAYANMRPPLYPQVLRDLILRQMIKHFGPDCPGLAVRIARCLWHRTENQVRSLQVIGGMGMPPWSDDLGQQTILLGAESLAGIAVVKCHLVSASMQAQYFGENPFNWGEYEQSMLAYPLMRQTKIAGCLLMVSTEPDAFNAIHHQLLERYAHLMTLTFEPDSFFDWKDIALCIMPPYSRQEPLLYQFHQRALQKVQHQRLSMSEAQEYVWQEIEEELIKLAIAKL
jgi:hypothetical protein